MPGKKLAEAAAKVDRTLKGDRLAVTDAAMARSRVDGGRRRIYTARYTLAAIRLLPPGAYSGAALLITAFRRRETAPGAAHRADQRQHRESRQDHQGRQHQGRSAVEPTMR